MKIMWVSGFRTPRHWWHLLGLRQDPFCSIQRSEFRADQAGYIARIISPNSYSFVGLRFDGTKREGGVPNELTIPITVQFHASATDGIEFRRADVTMKLSYEATPPVPTTSTLLPAQNTSVRSNWRPPTNRSASLLTDSLSDKPNITSCYSTPDVWKHTQSESTIFWDIASGPESEMVLRSHYTLNVTVAVESGKSCSIRIQLKARAVDSTDIVWETGNVDGDDISLVIMP